MSRLGRILAYSCLTILGLAGLVLVVIALLAAPPLEDLVALAAFLLTSGGITLALVLVIAHLSWPRWAGSLRARLLLASVFTVVLALVNVGFTAFLMFISPHDLAILAGLLGFALGISVLVAVVLSSSTTRSFHQVLEAVSQISAGDLTARVPVNSHDEVGQLAAAFNGMVERVADSVARERNLEQARRELIGSVSHDLRTPLASIRAMVESLNDGVVTDPQTVRRYLKTIEVEVESLNQLINDLFKLSQLDSGVLELQMETSSITDLISDTLESMSAQAMAGGRNIHLKGWVDGEVAYVLMDSRRVQRVLYNLVQNAMRHTPSDGTVSILARDIGPEVEVEVQDTGEGIPQEELSRVFERFYRTEQSRSRDSGGSGLGLAIAKGIIEAHGGRVWVESVSGKGSTFGFALPKRTSNKQIT